MQYERHRGVLALVDSLVDCFKSLKGKTCPVVRVLAVDVADAGSQHGNAQICNGLALLGICALALANDAVLFTADGTNLCLERQTQHIAGVLQDRGLLLVLLERQMRAVEHDGREAGVDAGLCALEGAVIQMQSNRNGDAQLLDHAVDHADNGLVAAHVLACALRYTEDDRRLELLSRQQDCLCPLEVVDVELADCILAGASLVQHVLCRN